jgi:predicted acyl esterase
MSRSWLAVLVLLVCARTEAQALPSTVQVPMPDGVTLATDVWRPLLDGTPRPVLLRRTPYGRAVDFSLAQALVGAGYVLVSQDVRGRGNSLGVFEPFFDDKVDGKATIEWAAKQPWSTGAVATYSNSAEGIVQYMAMADAPEGLRCAHLGMPTHDAYEGLFPGGAWRSELGTRWLTDLGAADVVALWKQHEVHDSYWDDATLSTSEMANIDHPVFIMGGFFDIFAPSQARALRELQTHAAPSARQDIFLILGPWTHGGIGLRGQGDLLYPEDALYTEWVNELLAYVKWCTQGGPRPELAQVRYYLTEVSDERMVDPADNVMRTVVRGEWREATSWPPRVEPQRLFVQDLAGARESVPVDPAAPVPSLGGGNLTTQAGPYEQSELDARADVLVFTSEPVRETVEIVGDPTATLWVSSATTDLDVIARLEVVTAEGKAFALTDGVRRGRFAQGYDRIRPLVPGQPTAFAITFGPLALRLRAGQALRVAISGTSSPRYEPNPNVATPLADGPTAVRTTLTLHGDSELVLPVALGTLPGVRGAPRDAGTAIVDAGRDAAVRLDASTPRPRDATVRDAMREPERESEGGCSVASTARCDLTLLLLLVLLRLGPSVRLVTRN